jgi:hypothetical protein
MKRHTKQRKMGEPHTKQIDTPVVPDTISTSVLDTLVTIPKYEDYLVMKKLV